MVSIISARLIPQRRGDATALKRSSVLASWETKAKSRHSRTMSYDSAVTQPKANKRFTQVDRDW